MPIETSRGYRVTLSVGQRRFIMMLADRDKHVLMNPQALNQTAQDGVNQLSVLGLITIHDLVGRSEKEYRLTDLGCQVMEQMEKTNKEELVQMRKEEMIYNPIPCRAKFFMLGDPNPKICGLLKGHEESGIFWHKEL